MIIMIQYESNKQEHEERPSYCDYVLLFTFSQRVKSVYIDACADGRRSTVRTVPHKQIKEQKVAREKSIDYYL